MSASHLSTIIWKDLQVGRSLGTGNYGEVFQGTWNGRQVAIKRLFLKKLSPHLTKEFEKEAQRIAACGERGEIIQLLGISNEVGNYSLVMEYMPKGSLQSVLNDQSIDLPWPNRFRLAIAIGKGLSCLHEKEILHCDLRSYNVLLDQNFDVKISDFGLSKIKLEARLNRPSTVKKSIGAVRWHAPELMTLSPVHTKATDVYAYAMVLWEIASRKTPYGLAEDLAIIKQVKEGERESIPEEAPAEYRQLIQRAWVKEPEKRPGARDLVFELEKFLVPKPAPVSPAVGSSPHSFLKIAWRDLKIVKVLGRGSFGVVSQGTWNGQHVAIKELVVDQEEEFDNETELMVQCQDSHVVQLLGVCKEPEHYALVMEYMEKGSLWHVLRDKDVDLPWNPIRWQIALDMIKGLAYLHEKKIVHRDLKSPKILLDSQMHAKISDFGLAKIKLKSTTKTASPMLGTIRWLAPEVVNGKAHSKESDVYSLGMILWELATRELPYSKAHHDLLVLDWIRKGHLEEIPADCPSGYKKLLQRCWAMAPEERPVATQAAKSLKRARIQSQVVFGKAQWEYFLADVGVEPPLPAQIDQILHSPCPFWPEKRVFETHLLTLIPETVNGKPFSLDALLELIKKPRQGQPTNYLSYNDCFNEYFRQQSMGPSHWVLMTRDLVPKSRNISFAQCQQLLAHAGKGEYSVPPLLDAATSILMAFFGKGEKLYGQEPWTYTFCQESDEDMQSVFGGFGRDGVYLNYYSADPHPSRGIAASRKLEA